MPALIPLLLGLAPTVASWILGDKTGAAVEKVTGIAREVLGTDDPAGIERALAADPNIALQFKMAVMKAEADARQADLDAVRIQIADVASARQQTVELAKAGSPISWGAPVVSVLAVAVFAGFVYMLFVAQIADGVREALMLMAGSAAAGFGAVLNYWLGSSAGSAQKTGLLDAIARKP